MRSEDESMRVGLFIPCYSLRDGASCNAITLERSEDLVWTI
jgi:hypothetical protein